MAVNNRGAPYQGSNTKDIVQKREQDGQHKFSRWALVYSVYRESSLGEVGPISVLPILFKVTSEVKMLG